jgi:hypothetical protein
MIAPKKDSSPLNPFWWFWFPICAALVLAVVEQFLPEATRAALYDENSPIEMGQAVVAFIAAGFGVACLKHCKGNKWLLGWVLLGTLASLFIGLEEISYGQQLFHWQTPEEWKAVNHQWETNLHNTSSWLNEKPKLLLWLGILTGGIVMPLLRRKKPGLLPEKFGVIYPDDVMFWPAVMTILAYIAKLLQKEGFVTLYGRTTEIHEFYLYYFVLLYFVLLRLRLKSA